MIPRPQDRDTAATRLDSAHPEYLSSAAKALGCEGIVTVWDDEGRYVGCMGAEAWRHLLTVSAGSVRDGAAATPSPGRYRLTFIFEAEDDADALRQEDAAYDAFDLGVVDQTLETLDGRKL